METINLEIINATPILTSLLSTLQSADVSSNVYLNRSRNYTQATTERPVQHTTNALGINESNLPEILQLLGIRSLTLSTEHDLSPLANSGIDIPNISNERYTWHYLKNEVVIGELRALFQKCQIIAFDDWSSLASASDLWNGLLNDVIKPTGKTNLEFIFYLGDSQRKLSFQVDEALDIISDFSRYGQVTFALDEDEAINLWKVLNGVHQEAPIANQTFPDLKRKYFSIFRTMNIARLLIYSANNAMLFTNEQQFALARKKVAPTIEMATNARQNFIEGFSVGLLLKLEMAHCLALGLVVFGSYGELNPSPKQQDLLTYINLWINDLQQPATLYLYQ